jgi:hypothetical protein
MFPFFWMQTNQRPLTILSQTFPATSLS